MPAKTPEAAVHVFVVSTAPSPWKEPKFGDHMHSSLSSHKVSSSPIWSPVISRAFRIKVSPPQVNASVDAVIELQSVTRFFAFVPSKDFKATGDVDNNRRSQKRHVPEVHGPLLALWNKAVLAPFPMT